MASICLVFKCLGSTVFKWHSKTRPFGIQPLFDHLNTRLVWDSDPHCTPNYETVLDQFCCFVDDDDGDGAPSKLMCHYFRSSDMNKEWSIEMAKDEEILAIACGQGWVRT